MRITMGMLRQILSEGPISVKPPQTPEQKKATFDLLKWAAEKMQVSAKEMRDIVEKAKKGDWKDAMDLLSTYYMMKGIKFKRADNGWN